MGTDFGNKAETYRFFADMIMKNIYALVFLYLMYMATNAMFEDPTWEGKAVFLGADGVFGGIFLTIIKHYFPPPGKKSW